VSDESIADELRRVVEAPPTRVVVVGGGVAGLVVARECARPGFAVTLLEASERLGGSVAPLELDGLTVDAGAESFAVRGGQVAELLDDLGLSGDVVEPNPAGAWVRHGDRTVPLPKAGVLGIPSSPLARDVVDAIGWAAAFRAYLDRIIPVLTIGQERRLGALVRKRMGAAVLERLVAPVATGVYSAQPDDLDVAVVAPGLNQALTRTGSLSGAVAELRSAAKAGSAAAGIRGGMWRLPAALAEQIAARRGVVEAGVPVVAVVPWEAADEADEADEAVVSDAEHPPRWIVRLADGRDVPADAVVLALPAEPALALLGTASPELGELASLGWPPASSVELVTFVIDDDRLSAAPRGTGVLVADTDGSEVTAKATTHSTAKWAWLADAAGAGRHVVRLSYGRAGKTSPTLDMPDEDVRALALADLCALYGVPVEESSVRAFARTPWTNALPYAALGERERIDRVRQAIEPVDGLEATGSWLSGTGLASVVPDARRTAERVRGLRWRALTEIL
jgi:oxygen-dependent protoporphyrinogen oxidase